MRLALFLPDSQNPYHRLSADAAAGVAQRYEIPLTVEFAERGSAEQLRQIQAALQASPRPDIVAIMPVQEADVAPVAAAAVESGVGWFWLNRSDGAYAELRRRFPRTPVCFVTPNQFEAGRIQGRQLAALLADGSQVLYVEGLAANQSAQHRAAGVREIFLRPDTGARIVASLEGRWSAAETTRVVGEWLSRNSSGESRIDAIACQSDRMAVGALEALQHAAARPKGALGTVHVLGIDGLPDVGRRMVDSGELAATVILPTTADKAVELAHACGRGEMPPPGIVLEPRAYPDEATLRGRRA